ncbi:hypothetical protein ACOSP7_000582 [Xanthoceras sorbifolium]
MRSQLNRPNSILEEKDKKKQVSPDQEMKIYKAPTADEKLQTVTVLSIDGGGSRGFIPAFILLHLEKYLQECDKDDTVRISDYFDVVAGSGTGSIIAAMLTVPDDYHNKRPRFDMQQIVDSLKEIFHTFTYFKYSWIYRLFTGRRVPQDDFNRIIRDKLKGTHLDETLKNVVIPVYNDKTKRPFIFSSSQPNKDRILLSDVVRGSSALPAYLDPLEIKYQGEDCRFIDGGLVSTNPTLFALQEAEKLVIKTEPDYKNYLVLSLGTTKRHGLPEITWHLLYWFFGIFSRGDWGSRALQYVYDTFSDATEIYMMQLLKCHHDNKNYLRIQAHREDSLTSFANPSESSTYQKLKNLVKVLYINPFAHLRPVPAIIDGSRGSINKLKNIGEKIRVNYVACINPYTGDVERKSQTNKEALKEFARKLSDERKKKGCRT